FILLLVLSCSTLPAQTTDRVAPGAPGHDAHWLSAAKNGFGTANSVPSRVWFTLNDGVLTEVYYPTLDVPNVQMLQLVIATPEGKIETESEDTTHSIEVMDNARSLSFRQENRAKSGAYVISKSYVTDPDRDSLLISVSFRAWKTDSSAYQLYVYYDPSLNNSGMHDSAWTEGNALIAEDGDKVSALIADPAFAETTNGYLGTSDGLEQLRTGKPIIDYQRAADGNVVQVGRPGRTRIVFGNRINFTLALAFGKKPSEALANAQASLRMGFEKVSDQYRAGWHSDLQGMPAVEARYQRQFNLAAMVLKALEDKTYRGAIIASPSIPWGGGPNANEPTISGYHAVWSRDLYEVATAFYAMGDTDAAKRALDYLFNVQQKQDGSFPQNSWVNGRAIGGGLQMDQVAFPVILAYQFGRTDRLTWLKHIKPAADFIIHHGPKTNQDRWEEKSGYSPATIAAEIAGLVCAAHIARLNGELRSAANYIRTADDWSQNVERWTATTTGPFGDGKYFLRISQNGNPNAGAKIEINSGGGVYDEREIVDEGFLELVRLGIKAADDPLILKSLAVADKLIKVETPVGAGWYRYNHDAYGERPDGGSYDGKNGGGRLWTLLTGERGEYELASGDRELARRRLDTMMAFANDGAMISEQVWDRQEKSAAGFRFGAGTGSATPLAWSMAQFIRLAINLDRGRNVETPRIVAERYLKKTGAVQNRER
ncbi:MAG TPA: glucan 1,4-alpha-glucosidase, partial [Pyrinomonadaceae bacterium]|nr:glucan 1,4-alpha-glucosidase [Pyrinomonadaceae bacterium]